MLGEPSGERSRRVLALAGRVTETEILDLCDVIPGEETARGRRPFERSAESLFTSGAFIHGGVCGLRTNCRSCPWTIALLACVIRCVCPGSSFSSVVLSRNIKTGPHRDMNNEVGSRNTVIKASSFSGGGLLLEDPGGTHKLIHEGQEVACKEATFESGAIQFDQSLLHATEEWTGTRVVIIGFTVRDLAKLGLEDKSYLDFLLGGGVVMHTAEQQMVAHKPKRVQAEDPFHGYMIAARAANYGDPLTVSWRGLHQSMCDGCGLNSPGRWRPGSRGLGLPSKPRDLAQKLHALVQGFVVEKISDVKKEFYRLSMGKMQEAPFGDVDMDRLRQGWFSLLPDPEAAKLVAEGQPFFLEALSQTSRILGDEDWEVLTRGADNYARGRMVGVDAPFPRVPLVFRPKKKFREYDDATYQAMNSNYASAALVPDQLEAQFAEEEVLGMMYPLSEKEAPCRFGDTLHVAALGAIAEDDGTVRPIFDGTHSVRLNNRIHIEDHLEFPGPPCVAWARYLC